MADIKRLKQRYRLYNEVEETDPDSELNKMIIRTKNVTQGPWYKCSKGTLEF